MNDFFESEKPLSTSNNKDMVRAIAYAMTYRWHNTEKPKQGQIFFFYSSYIPFARFKAYHLRNCFG